MGGGGKRDKRAASGMTEVQGNVRWIWFGGFSGLGGRGKRGIDRAQEDIYHCPVSSSRAAVKPKSK